MTRPSRVAGNAATLTPRAETPARPGMHPIEWTAELLGTFAVLFVGVSAVCLDFGPDDLLVVLSHGDRARIHGWSPESTVEVSLGGGPPGHLRSGVDRAPLPGFAHER